MENNLLSAQQKRYILVALMLTMSLAAMDMTIVATAIPQIVGDLGGFSIFSWLFSIYLLFQTVTTPIYGKLADIFGRKPIIITGIVIFMLGSVICAFAWDMVSLIAFRGIQAIGAGAIMSTVNTIAGDIYTVEERSKIQGWLSSVWGVSAILGPAIGGFIVEHTTWRWIFLINLPLGLIAFLLIKTFLIENIQHVQHKVDYKGAFSFLITGSLIMCLLMLSGQSWPWISLPTLIISLLIIVFIFITASIEKRAEEPILPRWIWTNKTLLGANLVTIGAGAMTMASDIYIPIFSQSVLSVGALAAGFILTSQSFTWPLFSSLSGKLYLRIGFRNTALVGIITALIGVSLFTWMSFPGEIWYLVMMQLVIGAGFGMTFTPTMVGIQSIVSWKNRGAVTGANMFSRYIGLSIGTAIFAAVFNFRLSKGMTAIPEELQAQLPAVNEVVSTLQNKHASTSVLEYLKEIFFNATHSVYFTAILLGVITIFILFRIPKKFEQIEGK